MMQRLRRAMAGASRPLALLIAASAGVAAHAAAKHEPPPVGAATLGVVINASDPLSLAIGEYYVTRRRIPEANVVRVAFDTRNDILGREEFARVKAQIDARLPATVQALALTWARPFRVDCASITTAFAFGFSPLDCAEKCTPTARSPYYDSNSHSPYADLRMRPAMSLAARDLEQARALIDRALLADGSQPAGTAYLLDTSDRARNVRARGYAAAREASGGRLRIETIRADHLEGRNDVMLYLTGLAHVPLITSNRFLPGAIADHLTSAGGDLFGTRQMSSLRWLEAGATGSFGTVVEPCAFTTKFPDPAVLIRRYSGGETLIEAYWKSVAMPGQGLFIGEPLARPFAGNDS